MPNPSLWPDGKKQGSVFFWGDEYFCIGHARTGKHMKLSKLTSVVVLIFTLVPLTGAQERAGGRRISEF